MQTIVISGSRNPEGQTGQALDALFQGILDKGGQGEKVFLPTMKIRRCRQCDDRGWGICIKEGKCVIEDDFAGLVEKIKAADAVVFATPVYFGDQSESIRAFLDRLRRTCMNEAGKDGINGKLAMGICVAGGGGGGAPACAVSLEQVLHTCGFDVLDMIPVRRQNFDIKLDILKTAGEWLATN